MNTYDAIVFTASEHGYLYYECVCISVACFTFVTDESLMYGTFCIIWALDITELPFIVPLPLDYSNCVVTAVSAEI